MSSSQPVLHGKTLPQKEREGREKKSKHISEEGTTACIPQTLGSFLVWKEISILREGVWEIPGRVNKTQTKTSVHSGPALAPSGPALTRIFSIPWFCGTPLVHLFS